MQHRSRSWDPKSTGSIDHFAVRLTDVVGESDVHTVTCAGQASS
jgi:hypothetical protein